MIDNYKNCYKYQSVRQSDEIIIEDLRVFAYHGVLEEEKKTGQEFFVNAVLYLDTRPAGRSDDLEQTINYAKVCDEICEHMTSECYDLIEAAAENTVRRLLQDHPAVYAIALELRKPHAPIERDFGCVSVKIRRSRHYAYIAFGSNMGDKEKTIEKGLGMLDAAEDVSLLKRSEMIVTEPYGGVEQDDFLNGVCLVETLLDPHELLDLLMHVEKECGRVREIRWGPRTLDLDILFYDDEIISDQRLNVPHIDMANRRFVLEPLAQLAPWKMHPVLGKTVSQLLTELEAKENR